MTKEPTPTPPPEPTPGIPPSDEQSWIYRILVFAFVLLFTALLTAPISLLVLL